jgi:hypothetical protein
MNYRRIVARARSQAGNGRIESWLTSVDHPMDEKSRRAADRYRHHDERKRRPSPAGGIVLELEMRVTRAACDGSQPRQLILRVASRIDLRMRFGDAAVFVDHVRDAFCELVFRCIGGAVRDPDTAVGVAEQRKGEVELLGEVGVVGDVVETRAEDGGVLFLVLVDEVPEPGTLSRSTRCVGLRIKPEHDLAATQIVKRNSVAVMIQDGEVRGFVANLQHSSSSQ